jgi:hypothetical protein
MDRDPIVVLEQRDLHLPMTWVPSPMHQTAPFDSELAATGKAAVDPARQDARMGRGRHWYRPPGDSTTAQWH